MKLRFSLNLDLNNNLSTDFFGNAKITDLIFNGLIANVVFTYSVLDCVV
jgi:uncharacterized PurR-regulated membrane protein YhhQ (DUF165 family)